MTISIHTQSKFEDYNFFKKKMDELLTSYPKIEKCFYGRSQSKEYATTYFKNSDTICENPKLSNFKIQNLYKQVENSDLSIFFFRDDVKVGSMLTSKTISRAKNLNKDFIVIEYSI